MRDSIIILSQITIIPFFLKKGIIEAYIIGIFPNIVKYFLTTRRKWGSLEDIILDTQG